MSVINRGPVIVDCCLMSDCYLQLFLDQLDNTKKILRTGSDCQIPERTQSEFSREEQFCLKNSNKIKFTVISHFRNEKETVSQVNFWD